MLRNSLILLLSVYLIGCSASRKISKSAREKILDNTALRTAHVGISIYDPESNKYLYNFQGDKYFVPASNTKIPTCYAAMKYLGDSLVAAKIYETSEMLHVIGTGDPSFLHPDFPFQPLYNYLKSVQSKSVSLTRKVIPFNADTRIIPVYGSGWSWNDYDANYMAERNFFPIYGNLVRFTVDSLKTMTIIPRFFKNRTSFSKTDSGALNIERERSQNLFYVSGKPKANNQITVPFITGHELGANKFEIVNTVDSLLSDTLDKPIVYSEMGLQQKDGLRKIYSQPTDSLLKPMMHRSDNFFAEQSLLMVSNEFLGFMNDARIIDTLLKTDFKDLPQKPRWVDGSGLSRYNLFTPQDFVAILNKMKKEFGMKRIQEILATGNEGTLTNYYLADSSFIYAKTGTLSGVVAISGFLYTKKQKLLIFSVLVNNHQASATQVRRVVESFIHGIRENY